MPEEIKEDKAQKEDAGQKADSAEQENTQVKEIKKPGKKKWVFLILPLIILGISVIGLKYAPDQFSFFMKKRFNTQEVNVDEDNLSEEIISPFFIPPGPADTTIRIDLSVIWDGLASVRFKKKELILRDMMYNKLYTIAEQNPDLNEKISYIENEVSSMLRSALGVQSLVVKIKEIRYF
ncbi:MAG: hypothetical protein JXL81_05460 [Deltaproteobacteria bacterium]|nr:hypothetical protein [Deltaproteobacteria bacterium]